MITFIFVLSLFGYLGFLAFLNLDLWITMGLIFVFEIFWIFIFWKENRTIKIRKWKKEEKGIHPIALKVDNKDGSHIIIDNKFLKNEIKKEIEDEILEAIANKVSSKIRENLEKEK